MDLIFSTRHSRKYRLDIRGLRGLPLAGDRCRPACPCSFKVLPEKKAIVFDCLLIHMVPISVLHIDFNQLESEEALKFTPVATPESSPLLFLLFHAKRRSQNTKFLPPFGPPNNSGGIKGEQDNFI